MIENRIIATLTQADVEAILAAINTIKQKLPFLLNLTADEKRALPKPGDKSQAFIRKAFDVATQNPDILPRVFNVDEMKRDIELAEAIKPILLAMMQLWEQLESTNIVINSESYAAALAVYQYAKAGGKAAALNDALDDMSKRFARKVNAAPPKTPAS